GNNWTGRELTSTRPIDGAVNAQRLEVNRLIVLVPDQGADGNELARQVWQLAAPCELPVLFVCALGAEGCRESAVRLRMATMAALIRDEHVNVSTQIVPHASWVTAVRHLWQPGNLVLCCAEQKVQTLASGKRPLWQVLEFALEAPVFVLAGLYTEPPQLHKSASGVNLQLNHWAMLAAIITAFLVVDAMIAQQVADLSQLTLLLVAGLVELGVIAVWGAST
ncbi:MAG TPA: hypothetical protein VGK81_12935, partial [Anaerolineae bacterium]